MKVRNMTNSKGKPVVNQFIIEDTKINKDNEITTSVYFQSYGSIIVEKNYFLDRTITKLSKNYWDYSTTTSKYRNLFLGETTKEIKEKIASGEYILTNLN